MFKKENKEIIIDPKKERILNTFGVVSAIAGLFTLLFIIVVLALDKYTFYFAFLPILSLPCAILGMLSQKDKSNGTIGLWLVILNLLLMSLQFIQYYYKVLAK